MSFSEIVPGRIYSVRMPNNVGAIMAGIANKTVGVELVPECDDYFASVTIYDGARLIRFYGIETAGLVIIDGKVFGDVEADDLNRQVWRDELLLEMAFADYCEDDADDFTWLNDAIRQHGPEGASVKLQITR